MSISDGQPVNAAASNAAWVSKTADDSKSGKFGLTNLDVVSGPDTFANIQRVLNRLNGATNVNESTLDGKTYSDPAAVLIDGDNHVQALLALAAKFHMTSGHGHTGVAGDGPILTAYLLSSVFFSIFGTGVTAPAPFMIANAQGSPDDVTGLLFDFNVYAQVNMRYTMWRRTDTSARRTHGRLVAHYDYEGAMWRLDDQPDGGELSGVSFTIDPTTGQVQYTSDNQTGASYDALLTTRIEMTFEKDVP